MLLVQSNNHGSVTPNICTLNDYLLTYLLTYRYLPIKRHAYARVAANKTE